MKEADDSSPDAADLVTETSAEGKARYLSGGRRIEQSELWSFVLVASTMVLYGAVLLPRDFLLFFIGMSLLDGYLTFYRMDTLISIERSLFAFIALLLTSTTTGYTVLPLMIECVVIIALLDTSALLRRIRYSDQQVRIIKRRLRSYLVSLVPALFFSFAMVYIYSSVAYTPQGSTIPLGISAAAVFIVILVVARILVSNRIK